jgi:hypothetical protein
MIVEYTDARPKLIPLVLARAYISLGRLVGLRAIPHCGSFPTVNPMPHRQKPHQLPGPTALATRMENISVGGFQIEFTIETSRGHGTMTPRAPEQEHVSHFTGSHRTPPIRG